MGESMSLITAVFFCRPTKTNGHWLSRTVYAILNSTLYATVKILKLLNVYISPALILSVSQISFNHFCHKYAGKKSPVLEWNSQINLIAILELELVCSEGSVMSK